MRCKMNVAVKAVQAMDRAAKGGEETTVKIRSPVRGNDNVRGALRSQPVCEVIHLRVRDVPSLAHG